MNHSFVTCSFRLTVISLGVVLVGGSLSASPATVYDSGDPTPTEQYLLERINVARANPAAEGDLLASAPAADANIAANYSHYGVSPATLRAQFAGYSARPPLAMNKILVGTARAHSLDQANTGVQSHTGSDGAAFDQRIIQAGYQWSLLAENVYAYTLNPFYGHVGLNADWGVPDLGHRMNIMSCNSDERYNGSKEVGIGVVNAVAKKDAQGNPFGPLVITEDFGAPSDHSKAFLVGVVYDDRNGNGQYDEGEGLGGVTVTPDSGDFYAVTGAAGGFTIPLPAGVSSLTVTAAGGGLGERRVKTVAVTAGVNAKLDFHAQDAPGAAPETVSATATVVEANPMTGQPGVVRITRSGGDNSRALTVPLRVGGAAVGGVDYAPLPGAAILPAGADSVEMPVVPLGNASATTVKKVKVFVTSGADYVVPNGTGPAKVRILPAAAP